ncbi:MAG TPA: hypothetical protein VKB78_14050 [Pirellulales bacterium]|nr:hypothetical protein [Pirellulales bacterium]
MAVRALRSRNTTLMEGAGAAISLEDMRSDPRNTVTELAILRHVAIKLGVEWSAILRTIARDSSAKMREFIERFARRDPETLRLELFLLRETIDANGLTIEKIPMPGLPLAAKKRRNLPPIGGQIDVHM